MSVPVQQWLSDSFIVKLEALFPSNVTLQEIINKKDYIALGNFLRRISSKGINPLHVLQNITNQEYLISLAEHYLQVTQLYKEWLMLYDWPITPDTIGITREIS